MKYARTNVVMADSSEPNPCIVQRLAAEHAAEPAQIIGFI